MQNSLRKRLTVVLIVLAIVPQLIVWGLVTARNFTEAGDQALVLQNEVAQRIANDLDAYIGSREDELRTMSDIYQIHQQDQEEQLRLLSSLLADENIYAELALLDAEGNEGLSLEGGGAVLVREVDHDDDDHHDDDDLHNDDDDHSDDDDHNHFEQPEFLEPKNNGETYFSPVETDEVTGEPFMTIALPLIDLRSGEFRGVLLGTFRFKPVWDLMERAQVPGSNIVYVVDSQNKIVAHRDSTVVLRGTEFLIPEEAGFHPGLENDNAAIATVSGDYGAEQLIVIAELPSFEAVSLAIGNFWISLVVILLTIPLAIYVSVRYSQRIVNPIQEMATTAQDISAGNLSKRVSIANPDEIGTLGTAFNDMTAQLQSTLSGLEQRVAERTQALATSAEVSRRLSTILDQETLVTAVVEQIQTAFNYYHAHIYLLDETSENLIMAGGTGKAGVAMLSSGHQVPIGKGLVGRAASTQTAVLIPDVSQEAGWLPNPLLPDTEAETAVPIIYGDTLLGVLDVQHNVVDGLEQSDVTLLESIAAQVAIAMQNARSYEQAQQKADREARFNEISRKIQSTTDLESALQVAVREVGRVLEAKETRVEFHTDRSKNGNGRNHEGKSDV